MNKRLRVVIIAGVFAIAFLALIVNATYLAVTGVHLISQEDIRDSDYATGRGSTTQTIYATRGDIYSSDGELLVTNIVTYKLIAILDTSRVTSDDSPAYVTDAATYASLLAPILNAPEEELYALLSQTDVYQTELGDYGSNLTAATKSKVEALGLSGLEFEQTTKRNYRYGSLAAHVIGYAVNDDDDASSITGITGIEQVYDDELSGVNGSYTYYYDSNGYTLPDGITNKIDAEDGYDVYLTINTEVQREAEIYMEKIVERDDVNYVWVLVMEAKTGKILAMATSPTYDPNTREIENAIDFNLNYPYEAGSIVKPFIYLTALDNDQYPAEGTTYRSGNYSLANGSVIINDFIRAGWGDITFDQGLIHSSNVAICNLLDKYISEEYVRDTYEKLSYWEELDLDGLTVSAGVDNTENSYVDYIMTGFGQSSTWTSYTMLRAYSLFANDGCIVEPYIIDYILDSDTNEVIYKGTTQKSEQIFTTESVEYVMNLMVDVVNDEANGTATQYKMDDIIVAGKSGTGQIYDQVLGYDSGIYNYSIALLAPYDDPEIVMLCVVQGEESCHHGDFAEMVMSLVRTSLNAVNGYTAASSTGTEIEYEMPNFMNHTLEYATKILNYSGIEPIVISNGSTVINQYPIAGDVITTTSKVFLVTDGSEITLPDFTGWSRKDIATYASLANITITYNGTGSATSQSVGAGTVVSAGTTITVELS